MKKVFPLLILLSLFALTGCNINLGTNSTPTVEQNKANQNPTTAATSEPAKPASDDSQLFKGIVADIPVTAKLIIKNGQISGTYSYDKVGKDIVVKGTLDKSNKIKFDEFGNGAEKNATATFTGELSENFSPTTQLSGDWQKKGSSNPGFFLFRAINLNGSFQVTSKSINEKTKTYSIETSYPELSGGGADLSKLNEHIRTTAEGLIKDFKTGDGIKGCGKGNGYPCSLTGNYSIVYLSNDLASIAYSDDAYLGGAHGNPADHAINFDLKNGKALELAELFKDKADYLKLLSTYCIKELKKREGIKDDPATIEEGAAPKKENFERWFLSPKGLIIGFEHYQVGSYADGTPFVTIPFSELKDVLKPDGATTVLMK